MIDSSVLRELLSGFKKFSSVWNSSPLKVSLLNWFEYLFHSHFDSFVWTPQTETNAIQKQRWILELAFLVQHQK